jgi:hypothetical protein
MSDDYLQYIGIIFWLILGFIGSGMEFAHAQREWPDIAAKGRAQDRFRALFAALFGPLNLLISLIICDWNHGWLNPLGSVRPAPRAEKGTK